MKKIGIVGGIGWRSTVGYYSEICRRADEWNAARPLTGIPSTPEIVIESLEMAKSLALLGRDGDEASWQRFDEYHRGAFRRLETAGADVAAMASNGPHHRFDEIVRGLEIPVISIADATAGECARIGARRVLILGRAVTMRSGRIRAVFAKHGVELSGPANREAREKTETLIAELQRGRMKGAATRLARIVRASWRQPEEPVVCLGCTELALVFAAYTPQPSFKYGGVMYVNTAAAHIRALLKFVGIEPQAEQRRVVREPSGFAGVADPAAIERGERSPEPVARFPGHNLTYW
jgi:aspartate racemase